MNFSRPMLPLRIRAPDHDRAIQSQMSWPVSVCGDLGQLSVPQRGYLLAARRLAPL